MLGARNSRQTKNANPWWLSLPAITSKLPSTWPPAMPPNLSLVFVFPYGHLFSGRWPYLAERSPYFVNNMLTDTKPRMTVCPLFCGPAHMDRRTLAMSQMGCQTVFVAGSVFDTIRSNEPATGDRCAFFERRRLSLAIRWVGVSSRKLGICPLKFVGFSSKSYAKEREPHRACSLADAGSELGRSKWGLRANTHRRQGTVFPGDLKQVPCHLEITQAEAV